MIYNNYAHIELNITSKTKNTIGNSANYKNLARWNNSEQGNITSVGTNGDSNYYGLFDISGQVYEWIEDSDNDKTEFKICRGGCYADIKPFNISKEHRQKYHFNSMLSDGFFGFRVATLNNSNALNNFISISDTGNAPDNCDKNLFGIVNYNYQINRYLVTNNEYSEFLNDADPEGSNLDFLYDVRMGSSPVGGILFVDCEESGSKYVVKPNMSNKPATFIKWIMAAKYINWLHANKSSAPISKLYNGAYNLTTSGTNIPRETGALYFLPNENEWYKAAYYDPTIQSYWKYGTKSNSDPLAVIPNILGSGQYVEGYHYSIKKFPILVSKLTDGVTSLAIESGASPLCPSISTSITSGINAGIYFVNHTISNLVYGSKYKYDFTKSTSNWPCKISPLSGEFTAYNSNQEINSILEFCPKNYQNVSVCDSNINYLFNTSIINNYYIDLSLNITSNNCSKESYTNNLINTTSLPTISNDLPYLNIEFLDSHDNSIILKDNLCCNPIPIILTVKNHEPAESYNYSISSSSDKILLVPSSGTVSFGKDIGKITSYALGLNSRSNNNISILTATLQKADDPSSVSNDQVLLQCVGNCEKSCDNHANFANKAIWGTCPDNTCPDRPNKPRLTGSVTTIGTNGGQGPYGTYDMDGNVWEAIHAGNIKASSASYAARGGSFKSLEIGKGQRYSFFGVGIDSGNDIGFRIASYSNPFNYQKLLSVQDIGTLPTGNIVDSTQYGSVDYNFMIGKYPVTNCEYAQFLNSVASTGVSINQSDLVYSSAMSGCYGGIDRTKSGSIAFPIFIYTVQQYMNYKPVVNLPTNAALRYINWLENNKRDGWDSTISGTYLLNAGNSAVISGNRSLCAKYFLPSENEWYKAAYYKGNNKNNTNAGYWNYSTKTTLKPDPVSATINGNGYIGDDCEESINNIVIIGCEPTPTPTPTPTASITPTITPTMTITPTNTPTISITPTITRTVSVTPTITRTVSVTPTISATPTVTPTISVTPTVTPTISVTPTITITNTPTISVTPTNTPTISITPTNTPTISVTPTKTVTPSVTSSQPIGRSWTDIIGSSDGTKLAATDADAYIYTSTDSGISWAPRVGAGARNWNNIVSSSDGIKLAAIDKNGNSPAYIYTSSDGGNTWAQRTSLGTRVWSDIAISNDGTKLAAIALEPNTGFRKIYISSDHGATWIDRTPISNPSVASNPIYYKIAISQNGNNIACAYYTTNNNVTITAYPSIFTSSDAGVNWDNRQLVYSGGLSGPFYMDLTYSGDATRLIAIISSGTLATTLNNGSTWTYKTFPVSINSQYNIASDNTGSKLLVITGSFTSNIYKTINSGDTWITIPSPNAVYAPLSITSSSDGNKFAIILGRYIYTSIDAGITWTRRAGF